MKNLINIIGVFLTYNVILYILFIISNYRNQNIKILGLKNKYINKISYIIDETDISFKIKNTNIFSTLTILALSIVLSIIAFILSYNFLHLFVSSFILAVFTLLVPYYIVRYISHSKKSQILKIFPNYVMSLKNYTDTNNDIIEAFRRAEVDKPLSSYIDKFNISVQKGVNIYDAFEKLKNSINIKKITQFISLLQFCYIYGGNFGDLLDKFCKIQMKSNINKEKEKQKIFSAKLVLIVLIMLNIYILFGFILKNDQYFSILVKTFIGKMILNINILSYIFIFYMYIKLNKMEE